MCISKSSCIPQLYSQFFSEHIQLVFLHIVAVPLSLGVLPLPSALRLLLVRAWNFSLRGLTGLHFTKTTRFLTITGYLLLLNTHITTLVSSVFLYTHFERYTLFNTINTKLSVGCCVSFSTTHRLIYISSNSIIGYFLCYLFSRETTRLAPQMLPAKCAALLFIVLKASDASYCQLPKLRGDKRSTSFHW
jgi:hypothetical protein